MNSSLRFGSRNSHFIFSSCPIPSLNLSVIPVPFTPSFMSHIPYSHSVILSCPASTLQHSRFISDCFSPLSDLSETPNSPTSIPYLLLLNIYRPFPSHFTTSLASHLVPQQTLVAFLTLPIQTDLSDTRRGTPAAATLEGIVPQTDNGAVKACTAHTDGGLWIKSSRDDLDKTPTRQLNVRE